MPLPLRPDRRVHLLAVRLLGHRRDIYGAGLPPPPVRSGHVLRARLRAPDPGDLRRGRLARRPRARGRRRQPLRRVPRVAGRAGVDRDRDPARTSAGSTASTRSSRSASPSAATPRSRSTTSGGRPASRSETTTSSTRSTSQADEAGRRAGGRRRGCAAASARARLHVDLHRRLLLRRAQLLARGGRGARPARRRRLLRDAGRAKRRCPARRSGRPSSRRRSSRSRRATTRTSPRSTTPPSSAALAAAGVEHEVVTYAGAPHSFFDRKQEEFADASEDAWRRVLDFLERHG